MSLIHCPECGHETSLNAVACPNCGRPLHAPPAVERKVFVAPPREGGFPPWAFVPIGIVAFVLLSVFFLMFSKSDDGNTNVRVNTAGRTTTSEPVRDTRVSTVPSSETQPVSVPGQQISVPGQTTTVPGTTTAPPNVPPSDKGTVVINAQVAPSKGSPQAARGTKFYLLDKDLETILNEARLEPIEGNSLTGSLGLAVVYPDRYGDFQRAAMRAVASHVKYSGTTSGTGSANLSGVVPNQYYLFGISRVGRGFALWDSSVSVIAGENVMNLSPQSITEIPES